MRKKITCLLITAAALLLPTRLPAASVQASAGTEGQDKLVESVLAGLRAG